MTSTTMFSLIRRLGLCAGLGAASLAPVGAFAQYDGGVAAAPHDGAHRGMRAGRMTQQLDLSAAQRAQVQSIRERAHARAQQLRASGQRAALHELRAQTRAEIRAILTPEQQRRADALHAERRRHRFERLSEHLQLEPTQRTRVQSVLEQAHRDREEIARRTPAGSEERRAAMLGIRARTHDALRAVLTSEQLERMQQLRAHRRGHRAR